MNKKKIKQITIFLILFLILVINIQGLVKYMKLKNESDKYSMELLEIDIKDSIDLVGLMDSYGVPYDKNVDKSFMDELKSILKSNEKLNSSLDLFNLYANKTWQLDGVFNNGVTIGEFNLIKNFSIDFTRHKYPHKIKDELNYEIDKEIEDVSIYEYVSNLENPIIVYSCTANDLFYYFGASPETLTVEKCVDIVKNFNKEAKTIGDHVSQNIDTIVECNEHSRIFVLGLYMPSDNYFLNLIGSNVIQKFNSEIKNTCDKHDNVYYVDVTCLAFNVLENDFHPNKNGQHIIAAKLAEGLNEKCKKQIDTTDKQPDKHKEIELNYSDDKEKPNFNINEIYNTMINSGFPMDDYVEFAVAFEWALYKCDLQDISFKEIESNFSSFLVKFDGDERDKMEQALKLEIAEKKMLFGIDETKNAMNPEGIKNDKLSLLEYY